MRVWRGLALGLALLAGPRPASGEVPHAGGVPAPKGPLAREEVPEPLAPWINWALWGREDVACPFVHGHAERRQCVWPSRLEVSVDESGGRFRQEWRVYTQAWVPLPGSARAWPEEVRVGDSPAVVLERDGAPSIRLRPGRHIVTGKLRWPTPPEFIRIPAETGLVSLSVSGKMRPVPRRDLEGRLWLQKPAEDREGESRLNVVVHRKVVDEVPLRIDAALELEVSGKSREVLLGRALPDGFSPMSLESPLPARIEPSGRLRVQVRPGTWRLRLVARHRGGPVTEIGLPERDPTRDGVWDEEEVWVFDARSHLRLVHVEGVPPVDPQQTTLPGDWMQLPAYLVTPGSRMRLVQKRRGDEDPAPDQLSLARIWWLDFDGGGYTVHDRINGVLHRSWRIETAPPTVLGRVAIDGRDQFISRLGAEDVGVEVRQGQVRIDADSRIEGAQRSIPAVGWSHDFQSVSGRLNLPPGWRLFHAGGVDDVKTTWTTRWSLLEIFLVLVTAMVVAQLWGWTWGALALVTLALIYPETGAPRWSWLFILGTQALLGVAPEGILRRSLRLVRLAAIGVLAVIAIPFVVTQARIALYPALEFEHVAIRAEADPMRVQAESERDELAQLQRAKRGRISGRSGELLAPAESILAPKASAPRHDLPAGLLDHYAPDPRARVSTGPGLPRWGWRAVDLSWRGPVQRDQQIYLILIPPWASLLLAWLRVALTALLALCVLDLGGLLARLGPRSWTATLLAVGLGGASAPSTAAADMPSQQILEELRGRLLEPPECFPGCAASQRMRLDITPEVLRVRIEIDTAASTAVPLPGGLRHWVPEKVLLDGTPASGLAHSPDGRLWIPLSPGSHRIELVGRLPDRDTVHIPLPLRPHRVTAQVRGWTLVGLRDGGLAGDSIQLARKRDAEPGAGPTLAPQDLPPFVRVDRRIRLGLSWRVDTQVVRLTPPGRALFLEVPLLDGESVTSETVEVHENTARVRMAPQDRSVRWTSALEQAPTIRLRAPPDTQWTEMWELDAAPVWHVEATGIPVVHTPTPRTPRVREWRPWPGEEVTLQITRPQSIDGRTLTVDHIALGVRPGLRTSELTLALSMRASRGVQHSLALPPGADLQKVEIDGRLQPIRANEGRVVLPVPPGSHRAVLVWRSPGAIGLYYATPSVDPGAPGVNAEIEIAVPADRWVLLVGGPRMGPAVLFWSLLIVALGLALGLGRVRLTPLGWGSWLLLFVGLTQIPVGMTLIVVGWLLALGWRRDGAGTASDAAFDLLQLLLVGWTAAALGVLVFGVQQGLLGLPDMQIAGNGSAGLLLRWYQDRSADSIASAWMISVPLGLYRLAMLAWALWLAVAVVAWLRWGWQCFSHDGLWRPLRRARPDPAAGS